MPEIGKMGEGAEIRDSIHMFVDVYTGLLKICARRSISYLREFEPYVSCR